MPIYQHNYMSGISYDYRLKRMLGDETARDVTLHWFPAYCEEEHLVIPEPIDLSNHSVDAYIAGLIVGRGYHVQHAFHEYRFRGMGQGEIAALSQADRERFFEMIRSATQDDNAHLKRILDLGEPLIILCEQAFRGDIFDRLRSLGVENPQKDAKIILAHRPESLMGLRYGTNLLLSCRYNYQRVIGGPWERFNAIYEYYG